MKQAFLVTFSVRTRVIADVPQGFDPNNVDFNDKPQAVAFDAIVAEGRKHIMENPEGYLDGDNIDCIDFDDDMPYGTLDDDK